MNKQQWRAVYIERCTYGSERGLWVIVIEIWRGTAFLLYFRNAVDFTFEALEERDPQHFALRQYKKYKLAAGLTFQYHLDQTRAGGNTIGRHLIQSFAPNEVTPEEAHEIGKKLATEILGGEYAFVMATHVDRGHVHNHFIWGAAG